MFQASCWSASKSFYPRRSRDSQNFKSTLRRREQPERQRGGLRGCRVSRGGGTGCEGPAGRPAVSPRWNTQWASAPPAAAPPPRPKPPSPLLSQPPRPLRWERDKGGSEVCRLPQSTVVHVLSLFRVRGKSPLPPPWPRRQWQVFEDPLSLAERTVHKLCF